mgnify:CR=1 FL=1
MAVARSDLEEVLEMLAEAQREMPPVDLAHWTPAMRIEEARLLLVSLATAADQPDEVEEERDELEQTVEDFYLSVEALFPRRKRAEVVTAAGKKVPGPSPAERAQVALDLLQARIEARDAKLTKRKAP